MPKRVMHGTVVSDMMDKTVIVEVTRQIKAPVYGKIVRRTKKYAAHDERNVCKIGDKVSIRECRPLSKRKHWEILAEAG
jgi:small subunit ribosomal protein S17